MPAALLHCLPCVRSVPLQALLVLSVGFALRGKWGQPIFQSSPTRAAPFPPRCQAGQSSAVILSPLPASRCPWGRIGPHGRNPLPGFNSGPDRLSRIPALPGFNPAEGQDSGPGSSRRSPPHSLPAFLLSSSHQKQKKGRSGFAGFVLPSCRKPVPKNCAHTFPTLFTLIL